MIVKAKHNIFFLSFFRLYTRWKLASNFEKVEFVGNYKTENKSILLISNHISWWDGFWAFYLNNLVFKKKFHFMMLREQLEKYWVFNYTGGFSVEKNTKSIVESLQYAIELLKENKNLVLLFPQGQIQSIHNEKFSFQGGVDKIIKNIDDSVQIIFLVNLLDYFSRPKPSLYMYFKEFDKQMLKLEKLEKRFQNFYDECVIKQKSLV